MNLKDKAKKIKIDIPAVFLAMKHKDTPWYARALAALTVGYALSPIDLIPDFIPILGYLDDIILLPIMIMLTVRLVPKPVMQQCREKAGDMWQDGKPKRWYYAIPIVFVWLLIIWLVLKLIFF